MRRAAPLFAAVLLSACVMKTGSTPSAAPGSEVTTPDAAPDATDEASGIAPRDSTETVPGPEHEGGVLSAPGEEGAEGETPAEGEGTEETPDAESEADAPQ